MKLTTIYTYVYAYVYTYVLLRSTLRTQDTNVNTHSAKLLYLVTMAPIRNRRNANRAEPYLSTTHGLISEIPELAMVDEEIVAKVSQRLNSHIQAMQNRHSSNACYYRSRIKELETQNTELTKQCTALNADNEQLRNRVEEQRQAAAGQEATLCELQSRLNHMYNGSAIQGVKMFMERAASDLYQAQCAFGVVSAASGCYVPGFTDSGESGSGTGLISVDVSPSIRNGSGPVFSHGPISEGARSTDMAV